MGIIEPLAIWIYLLTLIQQITERLLKLFRILDCHFWDDIGEVLDFDNFDVFEYGRPPMAIDVITKLKGVTFEEVKSSAIRYNITEDLIINVIHINQLIQNKMAVGRSKDKADVEYLKGK